ncbi:MAG: hypothetical protein ABWY00_07530, partial [Dongiaceae bacterium]
RVSDAGTFFLARSPRSLAGFLLSVAIVWIGLDASAIYMLFRDAGRHYAPPWADSLGIPLAAAPIPVMLLPVPLLAGWLIMRRASLPVNLWIWDHARIGQSIFFTVLFGIAGLAVLAHLVMATLYGDIIAIPLSILALYLMLSMRAALISKWRRAVALRR